MLKPGAALEIEVTIDDVPAVFAATVVAVTPNMISIRVPAERGASLPFTPGMPVRGDLVDRSAIVSFRSTVLARTRSGLAVDLELERPTGFQEKHRSYYRFTYRLPVTVRVRSPEGKVLGVHDMHTIDLGGGGVGLVTEVRLSAGAPVEVRLHLDAGDIEAGVLARGKVVRVAEQTRVEPIQYRVGIVFEQINETDRQRLIAFIFDKQREMRQKGVL